MNMKIREVKEKNTIHVIIAIIKEQVDIDFVHLEIA